MNGLKCLKCGGELEFEECFDTEYDTSQIFCTFLGHCKECGAQHSWDEVYEFSRYEELQLNE